MCRFVFLALCLGAVCSVHVGTRVRRGIFGGQTSTVYKVVEKKHYVPYSCVYVDPNLPNCRNLRFLWGPADVRNAFVSPDVIKPTEPLAEKNATAILKQDLTRRMDIVDGNATRAPSLGWGEYLGLYGPPVTVTEIRVTHTTVLDPRIAITFAVKGCKPRELPLNMEKCPEATRVPNLVEILPTSTVAHRVEPTKLPDLVPADSADQLTGAETALEGGDVGGPTQHL
ncbi:uncharacterized protein LOC132707096 isoform X2 [Cylas formicarius]|uniref:uncharacterized protein LOC132707096 isoform X2 n=1 Tax=Cylas formicarius TaxID=197179 RepID=UPI002958B23A|nr:uncharacterized protein LOC132707096 isoform X2 [Cylas formicarius]